MRMQRILIKGQHPRQAHVHAVAFLDHSVGGLAQVLEVLWSIENLPASSASASTSKKSTSSPFLPWRIISRTGAVSDASTVVPQARAFIIDQESTKGTVK